METLVQVLSANECSRIHEESMAILAKTGMRIDTQKGREFLRQAGAVIDDSTHVVYFFRDLIEASLQQAPKDFSLGARRPGYSIPMNSGQCAVVMDGGAIHTYDSEKQERRASTLDDWYQATRLGDCLDDINVYWSAIEGCWGITPGDVVSYWIALTENFSKHIQDSTKSPEASRWMMEVLQVIFGSREEIREKKPVSFLLCPASPLIIEETFSDAYLEIIDYGIPAVVMSMPLLGITSPASLISELVLVNCETLAMLCMLQAASPGTPFIYAATPAIADMRTGRYGSGEVEHTLLSAAVTQLARMYKLPAEASLGGSDHHLPGIQAAYERGVNFSLPILAKPDLLVGPGLLGGSTTYSQEQFILDTEIIRRYKRISTGISTTEEKWLSEIFHEIGIGGSFLKDRSTRKQTHSGEVYWSQLGHHGSYEQWLNSGSPDLLAQVRQGIQEILSENKPLPLPEEIKHELAFLESRARRSN